MSASRDDLHGTWRLRSVTGRDAATGERIDFFGKAPRGYLSYGRDGRMSAVLAMEERPHPVDGTNLTDGERVELFNTMAAYAGTFTVRDGTVTHHVDVSWNEQWTGTDQIRHFRIEGDRLRITSDAQPLGADGRMIVAELEWEKVR